jgi:hypothetical protein
LDLALRVNREGVDSFDFLGVVSGPADRNPAPRDLVAAPEDVESLKDQWGLRSYAYDEGIPGGEGDGSFLESEDVLADSPGKLGREVGIHRGKRDAGSLTGIPASWLMESLVSVKLLDRRAIAAALKFGAVGWASRSLKAFTIAVAWKGRRHRTGVGVNADVVDVRGVMSVTSSRSTTGMARAPVAMAKGRKAEKNLIFE